MQEAKQASLVSAQKGNSEQHQTGPPSSFVQLQQSGQNSTFQLTLLLAIPMNGDSNLGGENRSPIGDILSNTKGEDQISRRGKGNVFLNLCSSASCFDYVSGIYIDCWCCYSTISSDPPCFADREDCNSHCPQSQSHKSTESTN